MGQLRHVVRLVAVAASFALVALACTGGGEQKTGGQRSEITIAIGTEPPTLDPHITDDGAERAITDNVYETLLARTPEGELIPGLAAEMPVQVDESTWQFKLRSGIAFHDGTPFDGEAVAASVNRMVDLGNGTGQSGFFEGIKGAEVVDDLTVNVSTDGPDPLLPSRMYWMKMIAPGDADRPDFAESPNGTGPYRFVEWVRGDHITLEANDDYWGDAPSISRVTFRFIEDSGTRLAALLAGEIDLMTNLLPDDVARAPKFAHVQGLEHALVFLDSVEGITADIRVRQALNYAVNKEEIVANLYGGYAVVDNGQELSPSWFGYNPNLEPYPYDPDRARALLEKAGAVGQEIELVGTSGRWLRDKELVQTIAQFWSEVGLKPTVRILEFGKYGELIFASESRPDGIYTSNSNELLDADRDTSTFYSKDGVIKTNDNAELAAMIDQARVEVDPAQRQQLYWDITQIAYDQAYFVWLFNIEDIYGMSERLTWRPRVDAKLLVKEMSVIP